MNNENRERVAGQNQEFSLMRIDVQRVLPEHMLCRVAIYPFQRKSLRFPSFKSKRQLQLKESGA